MGMAEDIASKVSSASTDGGEPSGDASDASMKPGDHGKQIAAALGIKISSDNAIALENAIKDCVEASDSYSDTTAA